MNTLLEHFPKAARWAFIMLIVTVVQVVFQILALLNSRGTDVISTLITLGLLVWQAVLFHGYSKACKAAMDRGNDSDIELACLQQMRLVRFFGILTLILFVFGGLGSEMCIRDSYRPVCVACHAGNGRPLMLLDDALYVETPEGVQLAAVLADPLSRAQALLLDMLIIAVSLYVLAVLLSLLSAGLASQGIFTALAFVLVWGYFFLFEWLWRGVTPGKRALNLQVISADLMPLSAAQAAWRNVLRYLDWLPGFFGVGALALVLSPKNQRLGDWMAGTVVIFRRAPQMAVRPLQPGEVSPPPWRLSRQEQRVLMDFAAYADAHHEARLVELSAPLAVKMPDCDARERVQRLRAWGRYLRGMDGAT